MEGEREIERERGRERDRMGERGREKKRERESEREREREVLKGLSLNAFHRVMLKILYFLGSQNEF